MSTKSLLKKVIIILNKIKKTFLKSFTITLYFHSNSMSHETRDIFRHGDTQG